MTAFRRLLFSGLLVLFLWGAAGQPTAHRNTVLAEPATATPLIVNSPLASKLNTHVGEIAVAQTDLKSLALRYAREGWGTNPNWRSVWDELVSPDVVTHFASAPEPIVGLEANKAFNEGLFQGFPNIKQTIGDVLVDGDRVVYRSKLEGKQTGEFQGIPPTGKTAKVNDFTLLKFKDGKITETWYETNLLEVMQQLGLVE